MQQQLSIKLWFMEATGLPVFLVFVMTLIAFGSVFRRQRSKVSPRLPFSTYAAHNILWLKFGFNILIDATTVSRHTAKQQAAPISFFK